MQRGQRRRRRLATWLALVSIILQAIVLGTHLHSDVLPFNARSAAGGSAGRLVQGQQERRDLPAPAKQGADDCAICFALHLAAASPLPETPELPLALPNDVAFTSFGDPLDLPLLPYLHFRTRAPPVVEVDKASV
jgi:hypothetical protein